MRIRLTIPRQNSFFGGNKKDELESDCTKKLYESGNEKWFSKRLDPIQLFRFIEPVQWAVADTPCYLFVPVLVVMVVVAFLSTDSRTTPTKRRDRVRPDTARFSSDPLFHFNVNNTSNGSSSIRKIFSVLYLKIIFVHEFDGIVWKITNILFSRHFLDTKFEWIQEGGKVFFSFQEKMFYTLVSWI